jgi:site-specific DNA recombinase
MYNIIRNVVITRVKGASGKMIMTNEEIMKAVIYGRKSRDDQDSLEGQIEACKQWAEAQGILDYDIFVDEGDASSEDWNRPQLQAMLKNVKLGLYDAVIAVDQFRICRTDEFPIFRDILVENKCQFGSIEAGRFYNYENETDEMVSDVMTGIGKFQLAQIKKKLKRGTIQSALKGNYLGKKAPVGYYYDRTTKRLKQAANAYIIRDMFESYMNGMSTNDIAVKFNHDEKYQVEYIEKGIVKYMKWSSAGISRMLNNIVYLGHSLYGKTTQPKLKDEKGIRKRTTKKTSEEDQILVKGTHKPIVTQDEWNKVQAILQKRNVRVVPLKVSKHTFSGLISCSECTAIHTFQKSRGNKQRISSCQTRNYTDDLSSYTVCRNRGVNLDVFEEVFYAAFGERVEQLEKYLYLMNNDENSAAQQQKKQEALKAAKEKKIIDLKKKSKTIKENLEIGLYDEDEIQEKRDEVLDIKNQVKKLSDEVQAFETSVNESEVNQVETVLDRMKYFFTNKENPLMPEKEKNEILSEFVEKIIYNRTEKEIILYIIWKPEINEVLLESEEIIQAN